MFPVSGCCEHPCTSFCVDHKLSWPGNTAGTAGEQQPCLGGPAATHSVLLRGHQTGSQGDRSRFTFPLETGDSPHSSACSPTSVPGGVTWCLSVVFLCISLRLMSHGLPCAYRPFVHFLWREVFLDPFKSPLYILNTSPLPNTRSANIFSHSADCLFTFLMASFEIQKCSMFLKSDLPVTSLATWAFGVLCFLLRIV